MNKELDEDLQYKREKANVEIVFAPTSEEEVEHIQKAEKELSKAGISFDVGYRLPKNKIIWNFDWSLEGNIEVKVREKKQLKKGRKGG